MSSPRRTFPERSRWTRLLGIEGLALSDWQRLFTPATHTKAMSASSQASCLDGQWRKYQRVKTERDQNVEWRHWRGKKTFLLMVCKCNAKSAGWGFYIFISKEDISRLIPTSSSEQRHEVLLSSEMFMWESEIYLCWYVCVLLFSLNDCHVDHTGDTLN